MVVKELVGDKKNNDLLWKVVLSVLLCGIVLFNIGSLNGIVIIGDEYGYWAAGAFFAGRDWSQVTQLNPYYAYGYGILLAPLFFIFNNPSIMYKVAIGYNALFLCGSFWLSTNIGKQLFKKIDGRLIILVCFTINVYSNSIFQSQTTQIECLMIFLFWLICYLILKYLETGKLRWCLSLGAISSYMYMVHMRAIAIIIAICFMMFVLGGFKIVKRKHIFIFFFELIVLLLISVLIKQRLTDAYYSGGVMANANDYAGQISKIQYMLTFEGIKSFIISVIGKIYYLNSATFLLFSWSVLWMLKSILNFYRVKNAKAELSKNYYFYLFLLLSTVLTIAVSSVFMIDITRQDTLIYGRYNEHIIGPILLIGIVSLFKCNNRLKMHIAFCVIQIILTIIVYNALNRTGVEMLLDNNTVGIVTIILDVFKRLGKDNFAIMVSLQTLLLATLIVIALCLKKKNILQYLLLLVISFIWINRGFTVFRNNVELQQNRNLTNIVMCQYLEENILNENIYFINDKASYNYIDYLQFLMPNRKINVIEFDELKYVEKNSYILMYKSSILNEDIPKDYKPINDSYYFNVYQ